MGVFALGLHQIKEISAIWAVGAPTFVQAGGPFGVPGQLSRPIRDGQQLSKTGIMEKANAGLIGPSTSLMHSTLCDAPSSKQCSSDFLKISTTSVP
ncbi:uncharacterized [Tachysurus ichikawai]